MKTTIREVKLSDLALATLETDNSSLASDFLLEVRCVKGNFFELLPRLLELIDHYGQFGLRVEVSFSGIRLIDNNHNDHHNDN